MCEAIAAWRITISQRPSNERVFSYIVFYSFLSILFVTFYQDSNLSLTFFKLVKDQVLIVWITLK